MYLECTIVTFNVYVLEVQQESILKKNISRFLPQNRNKHIFNALAKLNSCSVRASVQRTGVSVQAVPCKFTFKYLFQYKPRLSDGSTLFVACLTTDCESTWMNVHFLYNLKLGDFHI